MNRTIILALSLAVVLLAATASTASADRDLSLWCAPLPTTPTHIEELPFGGCFENASQDGDGVAGPFFDFGDRQVGTTSPAQGFGLAVFVGTGTGNTDTLTPRISVSGDYAQTNNCPPTLSVFDRPGFGNQGCLITVTFNPTSTGPKKGTLSTGPGGPTVALTGNGVKHRTPPVMPLRLDASVKSPQQLGRKGVVRGIDAETEIGHCHVAGCPKYDSTLVLRGDVKKTKKRLKAGVDPASAGSATIKAKLKHLKQLKEEPTRPRIKIKFRATDEFGQTATEKRKVTLCSRLIRADNELESICRWHPSQK